MIVVKVSDVYFLCDRKVSVVCDTAAFRLLLSHYISHTSQHWCLSHLVSYLSTDVVTAPVSACDAGFSIVIILPRPIALCVVLPCVSLLEELTCD